MSAVVEKTTGAITVAVAGVQATMTHEDVATWGNTLMSLAPLLLILFLIWRMYKLDQQHKDCQERYEELQQSQQKMQEQLLMTFLATKSPNIRKELPTVEEFKTNTFVVPEH